VKRTGVRLPAGLGMFLCTVMSKPSSGLIHLPFQWLPKGANKEDTPFLSTGTQFADYLCATSWRGPSRLAWQLLSKPYIRKVPVFTLCQGTCSPEKIFVIVSDPLVEFRKSASIRRQLFRFPFQFITHQASYRRYSLRSYQLRNMKQKK
jgi:hypothetical protein